MKQTNSKAGKAGAWKRILFALIVSLLFIVVLEVSMRAVKSLMLDGVLHITSPSLNSEPNEKFGWLSPKSQSHIKSDPCYGTGIVSYNEDGFRAPAMTTVAKSDLRICILGDSTMQGYQIPDGKHLPHLLAHQLEGRGLKPYVLPLAVGGFGTTQQWMLFEEYCKPINPDLLIWHWAENDPTNNSFLADRYSGPNNARPRPYFDNGQITMRRAYPIHIHDEIDSMMVMKVLNGLILRATAVPKNETREFNEIGWQVAETMITRVTESVGRRIALVESNQVHAIEMFARQGFEVAVYESFPEESMCKPRDTHPNTKGHQQMLEALMPVVARQIDTL